MASSIKTNLLLYSKIANLPNINVTHYAINNVYVNVIEFASIIIDIADVDGSTIPESFAIQQNYPNPFNPSTVISFSLPNAERVSLIIYNILGGKVAALLNEELSAGHYQNNFDATNLATGPFLYQIRAGNLTQIRKMN